MSAIIANTTDDRLGAKGEVRPESCKPVRVSAHLKYLRQLVDSGQLAGDGIVQAIEFCRSILDSDEVTPRDKNGAAKTIATIAKLTADVAMQLHKDDRIDSGHATEGLTIFNVNVPGVPRADG